MSVDYLKSSKRRSLHRRSNFRRTTNVRHNCLKIANVRKNFYVHTDLHFGTTAHCWPRHSRRVRIRDTFLRNSKDDNNFMPMLEALTFNAPTTTVRRDAIERIQIAFDHRTYKFMLRQLLTARFNTPDALNTCSRRTRKIAATSLWF